MSTDPLQAKELFLQALERPLPTDRGAFLYEACGDDAALRQQVEFLLDAHQHAGSFLQQGVLLRDPPIDQPPTEGPGTEIGPYKLLQVIGEGGMGTVFLAEQTQPVQRTVALKIIKPGMDSRQVIARFETERQALALMDHVNIAKVLDAGTTEGARARGWGLEKPASESLPPALVPSPSPSPGRPYFVMELVKGAPITKYCDEHRLTVRQRLELFVPVCQAIQHAHQKGIIHRDLKPSNILVALYDGQPVPKVIDFGVAKATAQNLTERTRFTEFGQVVGTLEYMSPEQAELNPLDIDTRSDIYSLGVLLYELLTGSTPFDRQRLGTATFDEMLRVIREEEPETVSARLAKTRRVGSAHDRSAVGDPGGHSPPYTPVPSPSPQPSRLTELNWIVMKALEKDRSRRYETANDLALDLERYLHDEPVQACPPSVAYRFRKFARRNKVALTTGGLVCAALILGTSVSTWQAIRARQAERQARISLAAEKQALHDSEDARQRSEANLLKARQVVDQYLTLTSESRLLDVPGLQPLRKELLEAALKYYQDFLDQDPRDPQLQADVAAAHLRVGQIYTAIGSNSEALAALERGVKLVEKLHREYPEARDWQVRLAGTYKVGRDLHYGSEGPAALADALGLLQTAIRLWEQLAGEYAGVAGFRSDLAGLHSFLADLEMVSDRRDRALAEYLQARDLWETLARENPTVADYRAELSCSLDGIGKVLERLHRPQEAEESYRQSLVLRERLAAEFPDRPDYRTEVAYAELRLARLLPADRTEEAVTKLRQVQDLLVKLVAELPSVPSLRANLGISYYDLARLQQRMGRPEEAIRACRETLAIYEKLGADFPALHQYRERWASYCRDLAMMLLDAKRPEEAERYYAQAAEVMERLVADAPQQIIYRRRLAESYIGQGDLFWSSGRRGEAATAYRSAIELRQSVLAASADVPLYVRELARLLATCQDPKLRDSSRAIELANRAIQLAPGESASWYTLGLAHYAAGNWPAALAALEKSAENSGGGDNSDSLVPAIWLVRAMTCWQMSQSQELADEQRTRYRAEAGERYARAVEWLEKYKPETDELRRLRAEAAELLKRDSGDMDQELAKKQEPM